MIPEYAYYQTTTHDFRGHVELNMLGRAGQKRGLMQALLTG
jgi:hypothetical protein